MKKYNIYKTAVCAFVLGLSLSSCGDFLDQPDNSNYNADTFYNGDAGAIKAPILCTVCHGMISKEVSSKLVK